MRKQTSPRGRLRMIALAAGVALALAGCSAGSLGSSGGGDGVSLTFLVTSNENTVRAAKSVAEAFTAQNPGVTVDVETRPGGSEGDNIIKTRLATGDMTDLFLYNSGSLFQAIGPVQNLVPVTDQPWVAQLEDNFKRVVTADNQVYGSPFGPQMTGAVLYNKKVYAELGLQVPRTWDEFMANNAAVKAAGLVPVIQTYGDTYTSQLFVLGDFHNVAAAEPDFPERYTAGQAKYATSPAALKGWQHLQELHDLGYYNEDFPTAKLEDGLRKLGAGEGAHYPMLSNAIATLAVTSPEGARDIGIFPIPGADPAKNGLTVWSPSGIYIPKTTEGAELEAAKKLQAFIASPAGCDAQSAGSTPTGPYAVDGCELPADVVPATMDFQGYIDAGTYSPALEFLSPIKGPALEQITVEVGSGIRPAADGAALYDQDVRKQALQLGLPGWD
ncbi:carbohydrate ABC transporter substrate-binding protein (CUT1 family) [Pseudonocardia hierapolitana]|uniref:Carbohydrate ABC transporter substrate-binding protein (CUT1 family) n=1 Tax=Pseudonocardia hierapolitana TaxID=1128676 RepID=A0A561T297_9PSEU|nr:extracellular solute-binding protein [Pseudonocardia hierapolitana]TWF81236.1 carbohydrate ABC transporter substrate-binding protein (CUT1 family) [Pseudonocardia hierapolitana]